MLPQPSERRRRRARPQRSRCLPRRQDGCHRWPQARRGRAPAPPAASPRAGRRRADAAPAARQAARLAGGAPARLGAGHRPAVRARQRHGGPHHPCGPRRLRPAGVAGLRRAPSGHGRVDSAARYAERHEEEAIQGHRPAPQDRREDAGGQAPHPALRLCRGNRRHRAGGAARPTERDAGRPSAGADAAAVSDARARGGRARFPAGQRALRRRGRASSRATAPCTSASPRRPTTA